MKQEELEQHRCDPNERWPEADARGIFLTYVCGQCRAAKMAKYRPDVLRNPNYIADEDIEPEEPVANFPGWNAVNEDSPLYIRKPSGRYRVAEPEEIVELALLKINVEPGQKVRSPDDMTDFLMLKLGTLEHEVFVAVFLDNRHRVLAFEELFRGTIDGTTVYPREVVKRALMLNAAAVVFAHNHPSGEAVPSQADERITKRLKSGLELIDVRVLDHIIVASSGSCSFAKRGLI